MLSHKRGIGAAAPEDWRRRFGSRLVELREHLGWSQRELGRRSAIRPERLSRLERGERSPRFEELLSLQGALGVSFDYLMPGQTPEGGWDPPAPRETEVWIGHCLIAAGQRLLEIRRSGDDGR